jgi:hypothetical protein
MERQFTIFMVVWCILGLLHGVWNKYARVPLKRKAHPYLTVLEALVLITFFAWMTPKGAWVDAWPGLLMWVLAVALITFLNITCVQFCPSCGRANLYNRWQSKEWSCSYCGLNRIGNQNAAINRMGN